MIVICCDFCLWLVCLSVLYVQEQFAMGPVCLCVYVRVCVFARINPFSLPSIHQAVRRSRPLKDSSRQPQYRLPKYICSWESSSLSLPLFLILLLLLLLLKIERESAFEFENWQPGWISWGVDVCVGMFPSREWASPIFGGLTWKLSPWKGDIRIVPQHPSKLGGFIEQLCHTWHPLCSDPLEKCGLKNVHRNHLELFKCLVLSKHIKCRII